MTERTAPSRSQRLLAFVAANPGAQLKAISIHIAGSEPGRTQDQVLPLVAAQLTQQWKAGKLKRAGQPRGYSYWPTAHTLVDLRTVTREGKPRDTKATSRAPKPKQAAPAKPKPAPTPRPASQPSAVRKRTRTPAAACTGSVTADVAAFIAAGGRIQKLAMHEASQGLRFDHSHAHMPAKRRPVMRARKTATQ